MLEFSALRGRFRSDLRGGVAITFALLLTTLCGAAALAIDVNRAVTVSRRLEQSLDTAALAGAKMLDQDNMIDADIQTRVSNYFKAQGRILGLPPEVLTQLTVVIDRTNNSVTASATGSLKTTFGSVVGIGHVPIGKSATVVYKMRDVELALVMDTTGSMSEIPAGDVMAKIDSLKAAANVVVDTLYSQAVNERGIRIAIAPFGSAVNTGSYGATIASPGGVYSGYFSALMAGSGATGCAVERLGSDTTTDAGPYGSNRLRDLSTVGGNGNACPAAAIMPLMGRSQLNTIKATIADFAPDGSTAGHIGAAWGWYMLSPSWNGIFTGTSAPGAYHDPRISKNLVLMTDGLFNTSYLSGLQAGTAAATSESYSQFDAICSGAKANGITIYTIGFGLTDAAATTELSNCASGTANFFPVATGTELQAAFTAIVAKLNQLRLSR